MWGHHRRRSGPHPAEDSIIRDKGLQTLFQGAWFGADLQWSQPGPTNRYGSSKATRPLIDCGVRAPINSYSRDKKIEDGRLVDLTSLTQVLVGANALLREIDLVSPYAVGAPGASAG